jgi:ATP-dependent Zn protease
MTQFEHPDTYLPTRQHVEERAIVTLCGRAAEEIVIGSVCANAGGDEQSDLALATRLVCNLFSSLGMMGSLVYLGTENMPHFLRQDASLRRKVDDHLGVLYNRAIDLLRCHRSLVVQLATQLRDRRHLTGDEIKTMFEKQQSQADETDKIR